MFTEAQASQKSIFVTCEQKIDVESIYDNQKLPNKTRFSALPTKLLKSNMPVTFNKKIKSSGYGGAPSSIKYSTKEKQKIAQKQNEPLYEVSRDFNSKPLPMSIPADASVLAKTQLHKSSLLKLAYSPSGTKLAAASLDRTISLIKTPVI